MGSIEVYDAKQLKWVPYVPDYEKWRQHFHDIQEGYARPDHMGRYVVGSGRRHRKLKEMEAQQRQKEIEMLEAQQPVVKLVSPVAQAVEMVKSNMDREKRNVDSRVQRVVSSISVRKTKNRLIGTHSDVKRWIMNN